MTMIRVMLVEDQAMVLDALSTLLSMQADIDVVAVAANGRHALECLPQHSIDVLVTDIEMPGMDGLSLASSVLREPPESTPAVVIMTTYNRSGYVKRALDMGVQGFVLKEAPVEELADAIRAVYQGKRHYTPELVAAGLGDQNPLTPREQDVLRLAEQGLSGTAIAAKLFLSPGTVRNYLSEAMSKLQVDNRLAAAAKAREMGWL